MAAAVLQYVIMLMLGEIIFLCVTANFPTTEQNLTKHLSRRSPCTYPQGSIPCKVWNYTNVDCSYRELDCIPPLPHVASLKLLDLSRNEITNISGGIFSNLQELQSLGPSGNDISAVQHNAFNRLQELQHLDLSSNYISYMQGGALSELSNLLSLDLSWNFLSTLHNDTFSGLYKLQRLHLTSNNISFINSNVFRGINKLKDLDLSYNYKLRTLDGSPFQDLVLLEALNTVGTDLYRLTKVVFVGLSSLQELYVENIHLDTITTPFAELASLRHLDIGLYIKSASECVKAEKLFSGLDDLEYLSVRVKGHFCLNFDICSLTSLNSLELTNGNIINTSECLKKIPLKALRYTPPGRKSIYPPYSLLTHLTNLSIDIKADVPGAMKTLQSLNSPLQKLTINVYTNLTLNSTTLESFAKWNKSLCILRLYCRFGHNGYCSKVHIQGSPFNWFPNLFTLLLLSDFVDSTILYHKDTFKGLNNLQELSVEGLTGTNVFASGALKTFSRSNVLKIINFSGGHMTGEISGDQLCTISSSLETIDLSSNSFERFPDDLPCTLQNLKVLVMKEQGDYLNLFFKVMWQVAPNLNEFYASFAGVVTTDTCTVHTCRYLSLKILDLSRNSFYPGDEGEPEVYTPHLEVLYLAALYCQNIYIMDVPKIFRSNQLKYLSLSRNQISFIADQDAAFFPNLTFLDLSDNELASVSGLQYLRNLQILYLDKNKIGTVPKPVLSQFKGPYADHILIPQGSTGSSIFFFISNESPYFSDCKSKISASNSL